jgi:hypothetical protein
MSVQKVERWLPWLARFAWLLVAVIGGAAVDDAVDGRSDAVRWVAAVGGWASWTILTIAMLIASVRTLTIVRVGLPLSGVVAIFAAVAATDSIDLLALAAPALLASLAVFNAEFGRQFVQASAYGDEQRFPLRPPVAVAVAAVITWCAWAPCLVGGPLLLATGNWLLGVILTGIAFVGIVMIGPRWHRLSRRWLVFVPAGVVVHDPVVLADTVSLRTAQIGRIRLAPSSTEAADLTGPTSGYALQVDTIEPVTAVFAFTPSEPNGRAIHMTAFLVAPSRPGTALAAAAARHLPVG